MSIGSYIKILSVNCQGLNDDKKRKDVFEYYRKQNCNILCLIDTHFTEEIENNIRNEWGFEVVFNSYASNSRGIAILFSCNFEYNIYECVKDDNGNLLALDIKIENKRLTLACIYGPNEDSPTFFQTLSDIITRINNEEIIIVGGYNWVIDTSKDYFNYLHVNNPKARGKLLELISYFDLADIYREFHPNIERYTWRKPNPLKQARLDFFLISTSLITQVKKCDILTSFRSDHSPIMLVLKLNEFKHGKGLWKFNNSLLNIPEYVQSINNHIDEIKKQYALPIYNRENILDLPDSKIQFFINDQLFLETLLIEIRGKTISFASYLKKSRSIAEQKLIEEIGSLEEDYEMNMDIIYEKKQELENISKWEI